VDLNPVAVALDFMEPLLAPGSQARRILRAV
jgi:hypothetical protein